jgi:hypothetical protein
VLLVTGIMVLGWRLLQQSLPANAPKLVKGSSLVFWSVEFFSNQTEWCKAMMATTETGNFTFHYGQNQIANLAGLQGRKTFFESKELSFSAGWVYFPSPCYMAVLEQDRLIPLELAM